MAVQAATANPEQSLASASKSSPTPAPPISLDALGPDAIIDAPCDIWIPAARPDVIHMDNVDRLNARLVVEGANIPMTAEAEAELHRRRVLVIPDFIANAGVICAAVEYHGGTQTMAFATIEEKIRTNTALVLEQSAEAGMPPRQAAVAVGRLASKLPAAAGWASCDASCMELDRRNFLALMSAAGYPSPMDDTAMDGHLTAPDTVTLFLCGDVMLGRGIDQILPHPGDPQLYESHVKSAATYVELAERTKGPIPKPVDFRYVWGDALAELQRAQPHARIINLETSMAHPGFRGAGSGVRRPVRRLRHQEELFPFCVYYGRTERTRDRWGAFCFAALRVLRDTAMRP